MSNLAQWHQCPKEFSGGPCPICGCPKVKKRGWQHRLTVPSDNMPAAKWIGRSKSRDGWRYIAILEPNAEPQDMGQGKPLPPLVEFRECPKAKAAGHTLLADYYEETYEPIKLRSRSDRTKALYRSTLRSFAEFLQRAPVLSDLNDETVNRFLAWFRDLPRAAPSVNKQRNNLLAIWRYACRRGELAHWPDVEPEKCPKRIVQAWTMADMQKILWACSREFGKYHRVPCALWWAALIHLLWDTGERINAIRGLLWEHVDLSDGWMPAELRKGGREDRAYKLSDETVAALKAIRGPERDEVFPWPHEQNYLWTIYKRILHVAGLPHGPKDKFHRIRRTVASMYAAAGGNATELLGHTKAEITKAYIDPRIVPTPQAIDLVPRLKAADVKEGGAK